MPQLLWYWLYPLMMLSLGLLVIWRALPVSGAMAMLLSLPWLIGMLALWQQAATQHSGVQSPPATARTLSADSTVLTLLADCFPPVRTCPPGWRQLASLISSSALLLMAFVCCSAWNNQQLIAQTAERLRAFQSLSPTQEPARGMAAQQLQAWQQHLSTLTADGVPLRLGFGLYQGQHLADIVQRAIQSYHPPQPKPEVVRLDSTALFDSGQSVLKPEAKLALQSVLVWIQANPGKRVLIDGHTDNTGSRAANLRLSLARAEAVRQWLVQASTFPITHFAVQGLADTQPLYGNDDASGRSKNRRVEITLIAPPVGRQASGTTTGALPRSKEKQHGHTRLFVDEG